MALKVKYSGEDDWGRKTYKIIGSKRYVKLVGGKYYYSTIFGEPDNPVRQDVVVVGRK